MGTVKTIKHELRADHSKYDRAMTKSAGKTKKFSDSSRSLVSSIALIDGPLGGVASRASNLNTILRSGGFLMGTFTVAMSGAAFGMAKMLSVVSSVEVELGKTEAILRATGYSAGVFGGELDVMARQVARATLASTTEIRQAIASLASFKGVTRQNFKPVIELSQDMAAIWGGSAATNARKLGKALDDPVKQLSRLETTVGAFNSEIRETILETAKAGDTLKAQSLIIQELQGRIGGASVGSGLAYSVDSLGQAWDELFEAINQATGASGKVSDFLDRMTRGVDKLSEALTPLNANQLFSKKLDLEMKLSSTSNKHVRKTLVRELSKVNALLKEAVEIENSRAAKEGELYQKMLDRRRKEAEFERKKLNAEKIAKFEKEANDELDELIATGNDVRFQVAIEQYNQKIEMERKLREEKQKTIDSRVDILSTQLGDGFDTTSREDEMLQYESRMAQIEEYRLKDVLNHKASLEAMRDEQKRHSDAMAEITKYENEQMTKAKKDFFGHASYLMNSQSRKLFEIGKAAAISNAIVSGGEATVHAYKWGSKIGGPILGATFAAAAIAATATQIQAINSTQYGAKSSDSGISSAATTSSIPTETQDANRSVEIHFNGDVNGLNAELLAETLKNHIDQTDFILVDSNSRNGQELRV